MTFSDALPPSDPSPPVARATKRGPPPAIEARGPHTSFLQYLPGVERYYRYLLPLMPAAVESWRLPRCDMVVSLSHCAAKAVREEKRIQKEAEDMSKGFFENLGGQKK